jgi:hypothetical protein
VELQKKRELECLVTDRASAMSKKRVEEEAKKAKNLDSD